MTAEGEGNVFVHRLQGLEHEGVTRGGGFDAMGECDVNDVNK
jgi:hypothetical protein